VVLGGGRSWFVPEDLLELSALVAAQLRSFRRGVREIAPEL
jgi:hypothetical protein